MTGFRSDELTVDGVGWTPPTLEQWRAAQAEDAAKPKRQVEDRPTPADLVAAIRPSVAWMRDAACRDHPRPWIFFPARGQVSVEAVEMCQSCPVRVDCYLHGMSISPREPGIYGGVAQFERRKRRKAA